MLLVDANPSEVSLPKPSARRRKRLVWRLARWAAVLYLLAVLLVSMNQERLIFGGHAWQGHQWTTVQPAPDRELRMLKTALGDSVCVLFQKATDPLGATIRADSASRPTILFFYGAGGTMAGSMDQLAIWRTLGLNVAYVEYPGYGMSGGTPSESALYAAADALYDYVLSRSDIDKTKVISSGQSLGTGVAVELALRRKVAAVALFSPYTSMKEMAGIQYPWLPTSLILKHHFRTIDKIPQITGPLLIAHGTRDSIVPTEMSRRLIAAAAHAEVRSVFVEADHVDLFAIAAVETTDALRELIVRVNGAP